MSSWKTLEEGYGWETTIMGSLIITVQNDAEDDRPPDFYAYMDLEENQHRSAKLTKCRTANEAKLEALKRFKKRLQSLLVEVDKSIVEFPVNEVLES